MSIGASCRPLKKNHGYEIVKAKIPEFVSELCDVLEAAAGDLNS